MMLQPKYKLYQYDIYPLQKKTQQRKNNRTFYKYKKSERDFLVTAIDKIRYRLRNAACRSLHVLLQTFSCSCSPRPSQSCLSRFGHQILYTNIEGTRRPQSVPTILTETVTCRNKMLNGRRAFILNT